MKNASIRIVATRLVMSLTLMLATGCASEPEKDDPNKVSLETMHRVVGSVFPEKNQSEAWSPEGQQIQAQQAQQDAMARRLEQQQLAAAQQHLSPQQQQQYQQQQQLAAQQLASRNAQQPLAAPQTPNSQYTSAARWQTCMKAVQDSGGGQVQVPCYVIYVTNLSTANLYCTGIVNGMEPAQTTSTAINLRTAAPDQPFNVSQSAVVPARQVASVVTYVGRSPQNYSASCRATP